MKNKLSPHISHYNLLIRIIKECGIGDPLLINQLLQHQARNKAAAAISANHNGPIDTSASGELTSGEGGDTTVMDSKQISDNYELTSGEGGDTTVMDIKQISHNYELTSGEGGDTTVMDSKQISDNYELTSGEGGDTTVMDIKQISDNYELTSGEDGDTTVMDIKQISDNYELTSGEGGDTTVMDSKQISDNYDRIEPSEVSEDPDPSAEEPSSTPQSWWAYESTTEVTSAKNQGQISPLDRRSIKDTAVSNIPLNQDPRSQLVTQDADVPNILEYKSDFSNVVALTNLDTLENRLALVGGIPKILNNMMNDNVQPNIQTFTQLINLIPSNNDSELELLTIMKTHRVKPDITFFNMIIRERNLRLDYTSAKVCVLYIDIFCLSYWYIYRVSKILVQSK